MRDDVMGAFGDPAATGKPVGGDLREGKPTPLLARAVDAASPSELEVLRRVGRPDLDDAAIAAIQQANVDTGALAALEMHIGCLTDRAVGALEPMVAAGFDRGAAAELGALATYVSERDT
jgi:geranylgeranyl diphosphate synthase type I